MHQPFLIAAQLRDFDCTWQAMHWLDAELERAQQSNAA